MQEAVSQVLSERAREAEGVITKMVLVSLFAHAALIAVVVVMPESWRSTSVDVDANTMVISIAGAPGPDTGGMTPISGRPVQEVTPKPSVVTPPAPKPPEMVAPSETAKPAAKTPPKPVAKPVEKSASKKPATGKETKEGTALANNPGVAFGQGLSSGGGGGGAAYTDFANFCCPAYLTELVQLIKRNWQQNQGAAGQVQMKFTVLRDGTITNVEVEKPSNIALLDLASRRALDVTKKVTPLPREFPQDRLTVHLIFEYQR
jgi:TonB family protein